MSGLKASAGLALYASDRAELDAAPGSRNAVVPTAALPASSRIAARHLRKPISVDMFLEKPVYNPHALEPVPLPFVTPITVDDFVAWKEESGSGMKASPSGTSVPSLDMPSSRKKDKKDKKDKDKSMNSGRKTKRSKNSGATPHGEAPPPPPMGSAPAFPPPPPGPAPPPPI